MSTITTLIIDNGEPYDDHRTYFVRVDSAEDGLALRDMIEAAGRCSVYALGEMQWFGEGGPGFGPGFGPGRRGGRGRARRGDVRSAILSLLADGPANGYGLMKGIEERSGGIWRPSPGSVYPTLQQLTDEGLLEEVTTDGRAEHRLTDAGRNHVEEHREALDAAWAQLDESADEHVAFLQSMRKLVGVLKQLARDGSPEQRAAATAKVDALRKELYLLLAED